MYPRTLLAEELKSRAEGKVFDALAAGLDRDWEVFHSASWIVRDKERGSDDGEIDFVLCHPARGVICLEVKGGGLECRHGEWYRLADGGRERMRDPFTQALDHRYDLGRKLGGMVGKGGHKLRIGHAVALPDVSVHSLVLAPDAPREIVIDRNEIATIDAAIERCCEFHAGSAEPLTAPGPAAMKRIREALAPRIELRVPLGERFVDEQAGLITLTHEQSGLLNRLHQQPRMLITGPAGSGKTLLAIEQARQAAAEGKRVLFACFNRALRDHLRGAYRQENLTINNFHSTALALAKRAELTLSTDGGGEPTPEFWRDELPLALVDAIEQLGPQYDALFVDEAQDFNDDWIEALTSTLADPAEAQIWMFLDDNQRVYETELNVGADFMRWDLTVNCRNTQAIHREVIKKYEGRVRPEAMGPEGREVELYNSPDPAEVVRAKVAELCEREEVPPQDVVVLSSHAIERSPVARSGCGRFEYTKDPKPVGPYIRFASIRGYKGLESPVVILCELEDIDAETIDRQLYVGLSRARNHCIVVAPG